MWFRELVMVPYTRQAGVVLSLHLPAVVERAKLDTTLHLTQMAHSFTSYSYKYIYVDRIEKLAWFSAAAYYVFRFAPNCDLL